MNIEKKVARAQELVDLINYHDKLYFTENRQEISDAAYDELWFELKTLLENEEIRKHSRKLKMPLGAQTSFLDKVSHLVPVLSLDKVKSADSSFKKNIDKFDRSYNTGEGYLIESKLDGLTVVMYKQNGRVTFATRGGSNQGENVTEQMLQLDDVKSAADKAPEGIIVRGEAIIPKSKFEQSEKYSNARNAVSGALRSKEIGSFAAVEPKFVAYDIMSSHSVNEVEDLKTLHDLGFDVVEHEFVSENEDLYEAIKSAIESNWRDNEEFEIDGLVIKPVRKNKVEYDGDGHHAKGQIAVKFPPKGDVTYLRDIEFTVGKDGRMTPVAIYDEIEIDGVKMSRASVGSWSNLLKWNVSIGDKIYVVRSNDVIPQIDAVLERYDSSRKIVQPSDTWLDGAHLFTSVKSPIEERFAKFANALKIKAFNEKTYKTLLDNKMIEDFIDIFYLKDKRDEMLQIKGLGVKKVDLLLEEIELSRRSTFEQILNSMQYLALGKKACQSIAKTYKELEDFVSSDVEEIIRNVKNLNEPACKSLRQIFSSSTELDRLRAIGDEMKGAQS